MKNFITFLLSLSVSIFTAKAVTPSIDNTPKPRIVVLTDIAPADVEADDMESLVRLLSHADLFEIEAIITSGGWNSSGGTYPVEWAKFANEVIDAYEKDLPNLMRRSDQTEFKSITKEEQTQNIGYWPSATYLRKRTMMGSRSLGVDKLGKDNDSPGSELLIKLAEEKDSRPIWILVWGGGNTVAQALWKIKNDCDSKRLEKFVDKIRIYSITDQDVDWGQREQHQLSSHKWMRENFGERLMFIWDESAWLTQNYIGASHWKDYETHIQGKGNLGSVYPHYKWGVEGDSPSFFYIMPVGLSNPEDPAQGSYGGYFKKSLSNDKSTVCYNNTLEDVSKISRKYEEYFYPSIFNNFAARMEWAATGKGNRNPIVIVKGQKGLDPVIIKSAENRSVRLDASKSYDPDNDNLKIKWWILPEASNYDGKAVVKDADTATASLLIAAGDSGKSIHIICEVTDDGNFNLKSYRRVIINVK